MIFVSEKPEFRDKDTTLQDEVHWQVDYSDYVDPIFCINFFLLGFALQNCSHLEDSKHEHIDKKSVTY